MKDGSIDEFTFTDFLFMFHHNDRYFMNYLVFRRTKFCTRDIGSGEAFVDKQYFEN